MIFALLFIFSVESAFASTIVRDLFQTHNTIVFNDIVKRFEIEGPVLIGGNTSVLQSIQFGANIPLYKEDIILASFGNIDAGENWINLNLGSIISPNQKSSLNINFNSGGTFSTSLDDWNSYLQNQIGIMSIDQLYQETINYSTFLSNLSFSGTVNTTDPNKFQFIGDGNQFSAMNIDATVLSGARGIEINLNGSETLIVSVTNANANSIDINANFLGNQNQVIWNFVDSEIININGSRWQGAILAPNADLFLKGGYNGTVFASSLRADDEGHFNPIVAPIPEPSVFLVLSFFAIYLCAHRKRY